MERRLQNLECRRIFVARLANGTKRQHLLRVFQTAGATHAVVRRKPTGNVAFVTFPSINQARDAIESAVASPITLHGRRLAISMADAWNSRDSVPSRPKVTDTRSDPVNGLINTIDLPAEVVDMIAKYMCYQDLARMEQVSRSWRAGVMMNLRRIQNLSFQDWRWPRDWTSVNVTKDSLVWIVKRYAPSLKNVRFTEAEATIDLRPQCLTIMASYASRIEYLDLSGFRVLPTGLRTIAENLHCLTTLKLGQVEGPVDPDLSWIFKGDNLRHFSAINTPIFGAALSSLNPEVEEFALVEVPTKPKNLADGINRCRNLVSLKLRRLRDFNNVILESIAQNETLGTTLKEVTLDWCNPQPSLDEEDTEMNENQGIPANFVELPELGIETSWTIVPRLVSVVSLKARFNGWIDNTFINELGQNATNLQILDITGSTNIRGQFSLDLLGHLTGLTKLIMSRLHPSVGASFLAELQHLTNLVCQDNQGVNDEDICGLLRNCQTIRIVDLEGCSQIGRPLIDCVYQVFRGNPRDLQFNLWVGGTGARPYRRDRRMMHVRIVYERQSQDPYE